MLWVEIDTLDACRKRVWCVEVLDALKMIKVFNHTVFPKKFLYLRTLLKGWIFLCYRQRLSLLIIAYCINIQNYSR